MQNKNTPKLEILTEMGKDVFNFFKNIGKGYAGEQLVTTFNKSGYRIAKKCLNSDFSLEGSEGIGQITGLAQDVLCGLIGYCYALDHISSSEIMGDSLYVTVPAAIAGTKVLMSIIGYVGSKAYNSYKSAEKKIETSKESEQDSTSVLFCR